MEQFISKIVVVGGDYNHCISWSFKSNCVDYLAENSRDSKFQCSIPQGREMPVAQQDIMFQHPPKEIHGISFSFVHTFIIYIKQDFSPFVPIKFGFLVTISRTLSTRPSHKAVTATSNSAPMLRYNEDSCRFSRKSNDTEL